MENDYQYLDPDRKYTYRNGVLYNLANIEDDKKGEKIVLLISNVNEEFILKLKEKFLKFFDNKLMIPSSIKIVQEVPKLGTGKKDFSKAKL